MSWQGEKIMPGPIWHDDSFARQVERNERARQAEKRRPLYLPPEPKPAGQGERGGG